MELSGTIVPMATPIRGQGQGIDNGTLEAFTRSLVDAGVHGLFPGSSIGEFPSLTTEQNCTAVRTVAEAADDSTAVLAGCCATSVDEVLVNVDAAADAGADAAVVVTPYYLSATQQGLRRFFERVADESTLPVLMYNIPALTGNALDVETVKALAAHDRIVGLKDTSGSLTYQYEVLTSTPDDFLLFQGATDNATASLNIGADGIIAGPANVFPEAMAELYEAHARGDDATVNRIAREVIMPVVTATSDIPTASAVKYLVGLDGMDLGEPLPPLSPLTASERDRLDACYRQVSEALDVRAVGD